MVSQLDLLNELVADGHDTFTFDQARQTAKVSAKTTAKVLRRLLNRGLVDRVAAGRYVVRPAGSFGTAATSESLPLAVGTALSGVSHRIAYASALSEHGLLTHPVRTVTVACERQVRISALGGRPFRCVIEQPATIHLGAEAVGPSWQSSTERALLDAAMRLDLVNGVEELAEALTSAADQVGPGVLAELAGALGDKGLAAGRRLASIARALELALDLPLRPAKDRLPVRLDPRDSRAEWLDAEFKVIWPIPASELAAVTGN